MDRNGAFKLAKNTNYQNDMIIIQISFENQYQMFVTTISGDIGERVFYANGYLGQDLGIFFNRAIATRIECNGLTIRLKPIYEKVI